MWLYLWLFIWLKAPGSSAEVGTCKAFCLSGPFSISFSVQFGLCYITLSGSSFHPIFVLFLYAFPKLSRNMFHKTWSWCSFLPLCLPSAHWNPMSTTTFSVKPVWHFFFLPAIIHTLWWLHIHFFQALPECYLLFCLMFCLAVQLFWEKLGPLHEYLFHGPTFVWSCSIFSEDICPI